MGVVWTFLLSAIFSPLSPSLWEAARHRLKYCLKGPLNPKQPTNYARPAKPGPIRTRVCGPCTAAIAGFQIRFRTLVVLSLFTERLRRNFISFRHMLKCVHKTSVSFIRLLLAIVLLPLLQEGQLSVTGESMCTKYWLTLRRSKPAREKCG